MAQIDDPQEPLPRSPRHTARIVILCVVGAVVLYFVVGTLIAVFGPKAFEALEGDHRQYADLENRFERFEGALDLYRMSHKAYPQKLEDLLAEGKHGGEPPLAEMPLDPWGNPFAYELHDRRTFWIRSAGPDGRLGTVDDLVHPNRKSHEGPPGFGAEPVTMSFDAFWQVIEDAAGGDHSDMAALEKRLAKRVAALSVGQLQGFSLCFEALMACTEDERLWSAAALIQGGCSDDCWMDFCSTLILLGRDAYTNALADPDTLADVIPTLSAPSQLFHEGFAYVTHDAIRDRCPRWGGRPLATDGVMVRPPVDDAALPSTFPRLWKRFGKQ